MLILTRRTGESLMIGDDVQVMVLGVKGNQVRIGITAPPEIAVHREEIYYKIKEDSLANAVKDTAAETVPCPECDADLTNDIVAARANCSSCDNQINI